MLRKYILVCYYGGLPINNLISPHKSGPLKTQFPQAPPPLTKKKKKKVLEIFLVFIVTNNFFIPS